MNKIASVDVFILFDTVQLPRGKSRALRAKYIDQNGEKWLTIPYGKKGEMFDIKDVKLQDLSWKNKHLKKMKNAYLKGPCKDWALEVVNECLFPDDSYFLIDIEQKIIETLSNTLEIDTKLIRASELLPYEGVNLQEYVICLLEKLDAGTYLSGNNEGSRKSINEELFRQKGIKIEYQDFKVPPYQHVTGIEFTNTVSVVDALFNLGKLAKHHVHN